jgi:hypothetical protein
MEFLPRMPFGIAFPVSLARMELATFAASLPNLAS